MTRDLPFLVQGSKDGQNWEDFFHLARPCRAQDAAKMLVAKKAMGIRRARVIFMARVIFEVPDFKIPQIIEGVEI